MRGEADVFDGGGSVGTSREGRPRRRRTAAAIALTLTLALSACADSVTTVAPPPTTPASSAVVVDAIEQTIRNGSVGLSTIKAVLVSGNGTTLVAHYRDGATPNDAFHVWSVTKSVTSALIGIALSERLIPSLDATLAQLLPRYRAQLGPEQSRITLRQLMTMSAGYDDTSLGDLGALVGTAGDPIPAILKKGVAEKPGTTFTYSNTGAHLVTAVLRAALQRVDGARPRSILEYARQKLFDHLGIVSRPAIDTSVRRLSPEAFEASTEFGWATDGGGLQSGCCLLRLRPEDMVKIGELYLGDGVWHGTRILPVGWVDQTMAPSALRPQYGLMWWLETDALGNTMWAAEGTPGELIAVLPQRHLVVVISSVATRDYETSNNDLVFLAVNTILPILN